MKLINIEKRIAHTVEDVSSLYEIIVLPLVSLPCLLQSFIFLFFRFRSAYHIGHIEGSQKDKHLLLPSSKFHTQKLVQFHQVRSEFPNARHDRINYHNRLLQIIMRKINYKYKMIFVVSPLCMEMDSLLE